MIASALSILLVTAAAAPTLYFHIQVVDEQTGRGVPLVELRTVNDRQYYTDSGGNVAFYEPGLMNRSVFFHVRSHGYEFPRDGFGFHGRSLQTVPGDKVVLKIRRLNIAERLYRVTGQGIYRDTILVGDKPPVREGLLNAQVLGSDSVVNAVYRGKIYWFWGDTQRPSYPLGNFHVPGAISLLPPHGGLDPNVGVDLEYFVDEQGFAKETARLPGEGPTWIDSLVVLPGTDGTEELYARYVKIKPPMEVYECGLVQFNDQDQRWEKRTEFDPTAKCLPGGHPVLHSDSGVPYIYFATPYPWVRVRADRDALADLEQYEAYTCFQQGVQGEPWQLDRDPAGQLVYAWKRNAMPLTEALQQQLIESGRLRPDEGLFVLSDVESDKRVVLHSGSVNWNPFRKRWILIGLESGGSSSYLGEVWYSEAESITGPWWKARKIVSHDQYSFYNVKHHPMLDSEGSRVIFFEGTYANTFSGNPSPTPGYNYNQIMYRLDLSDPRLDACRRHELPAPQ